MKMAILFLLTVLICIPLPAAVGCDLNDPDRDVRRLFPDSSGYRTEYVSISRQGGPEMLKRIETRLGDRFQGLFETAEVPYTMYRIFKGTKLIGFIHGVNQKGQYGGIQVFLALDPGGAIKAFYIQKLTSKGAAALRSEDFARPFAGLSLTDLSGYNVQIGQFPPGHIGTRLKNPSPTAETDFKAILRATKKNLILVDEFLLGNRYFKAQGGRP